MSETATPTAAPEPAYLVVVNDEAQYSIWEESLPLPGGWRAEGFAGPKADCLAHVERVWTDLRPLSARRG